MAKPYHVTKGRNGWSVHRHGARRASRRLREKIDAILWAESRQTKGGIVVVHRDDGMIEEEITVG